MRRQVSGDVRAGTPPASVAKSAWLIRARIRPGVGGATSVVAVAMVLAGARWRYCARQPVTRDPGPDNDRATGRSIQPDASRETHEQQLGAQHVSSGFVARTKALTNVPSSSVASAWASSPSAARNARASCTS